MVQAIKMAPSLCTTSSSHIRMDPNYKSRIFGRKLFDALWAMLPPLTWIKLAKPSITLDKEASKFSFLVKYLASFKF